MIKLNWREVWHIFWDLTHFSDALVILQMHDPYKWDTRFHANDKVTTKTRSASVKVPNFVNKLIFFKETHMDCLRHTQSFSQSVLL